jgi:beta-lactamase class A
MRPERRLLLTRRSFGLGVTVTVAAAPALADDDVFSAIEARTGGRLGVAALNLTTGARLTHRADERFPMCSTFKALAVAAVLARVDRGSERLDRWIAYRRADILPHAPITEAHVAEGGLPLEALCMAAVTQSDNTAANLILATLGGPAEVTHYARSLGDAVTRLDRNEMTLNTAVPGDPRDTTSPAAMLGDLRAICLGDALSPASRERLTGWMKANRTGDMRLRAGLPKGWTIGDKTGTGVNGTANDIAIAWTQNRPIVVCAYLTGAKVSDSDQDAAIAEVGRIVAERFSGTPARG